MKLNKDQILILVFAVAFFVSTFLYFQSLNTIKFMYEESTVHSLETEVVIDPNTELPKTPEVISAPINTATTTPEPIKPKPVEPVVDNKCYVGGCSSQLCGDASIKDIATTCEWKEEYACYREPNTTCERQVSGTCGWTKTEELNSCLLGAQGATESSATSYQII